MLHRLAFLFLILALPALVTPAGAAQTDRMIVFADSSTRAAVVELIGQFERDTIHRVTPTFDSSGAIAQLIENGTHPDIVVVAGQETADRLAKRGFFHDKTLVPLMGLPVPGGASNVIFLAIMATHNRPITRVFYDYLRSARAGETYRRNGFLTN